jgi:hypothetical protein
MYELVKVVVIEFLFKKSLIFYLDTGVFNLTKSGKEAVKINDCANCLEI